MKKFLSLCATMICACTMFAGVVNFMPADFAGQGTSSSGSAVSLTKDGVTVACSKGYGASESLRCYKGSSLSISSTSTIQKINLEFAASDKTGSLDAEIVVNALSWQVDALPSQARLSKISVTIDAEVVEVPVDTITVTQALARMADSEGNKGECYVKGKVLSIITNNIETYGYISYWMADIDNPTDSLQAYRMKGADNTAYPNAAAIEFVEDDEILVYAAGLAIYHNSSNNQDIPEINTGYYVRTISGADIVNLDWNVGNAYRETGKWVLEIEKVAGQAANVLRLVFSSDQETSIAGYHALENGSTITINGATTAITGSIKLTFKEINNNYLNVYTVQASMFAGDVAYRLNRDIKFYAQDSNGDEIVLIGDRPFIPNNGDTITCAQAREYTLSLGSGETSTMTVTVRGFITDIFSNGITFWMDDQQGTAKTIQAYYCTMPTGVNVVNDTEVFVTGKLKNYNGTPEIDHGTVEVISGGEETPDPIIPDTASHNPDAKLWPIVMDDIYAHANAEYIVGDIRMDGEENHLYVWASGETYTPVSRGGKNFYGNNEGYLAFDVAAPDGWSGMGFCVENAQSISAIQALKENIVNNPDDIYLHMAIKSTTAGNHQFYTFGTNATSFAIGTATIEAGPVIGDFERDGKWHELFIPMAPFASAISTVDVRSGINILCILSGNAVGAQLDLDAIYFCDMAFMNKAIKPLPEPEDFDVIYRYQDNEIIDSEQVTLTLPEAPIIPGFTFLKWVVVAGDLDEGINIQATYQYNGDATSAPSAFVNPANPAQKLIRNGKVYILHNGNTYTATGVKVE